ncbi:MAG: hypothetical protein GQ470_01865 [Gammaproteobacteria bacterium]|nr:hypothetical protein [Gammaproteobacteria bacterium]
MKAIQDHTSWKIRIQSLVNKDDLGSVNLYEISSDEHCELGKWILSMDKKIGHTYALSRLRNFHREFHKAAGEAVELAQEGDMKKAKAIINGEYSRLSREVVNSLLAMGKRTHHSD